MPRHGFWSMMHKRVPIFRCGSACFTYSSLVPEENGRWIQRLRREAAELTQLNPDQQAASESASIARRKRVRRPGRCRRSPRCLPQSPGQVMRQRCDRGLTTGDAVPPPDYADASRNTTPFLSSLLTFPRQHGTHSISYAVFCLKKKTCIVAEVDVWLSDTLPAWD